MVAWYSGYVGLERYAREIRRCSLYNICSNGRLSRLLDTSGSQRSGDQNIFLRPGSYLRRSRRRGTLSFSIPKFVLARHG